MISALKKWILGAVAVVALGKILRNISEIYIADVLADRTVKVIDEHEARAASSSGDHPLKAENGARMARTVPASATKVVKTTIVFSSGFPFAEVWCCSGNREYSELVISRLLAEIPNLRRGVSVEDSVDLDTSFRAVRILYPRAHFDRLSLLRNALAPDVKIVDDRQDGLVVPVVLVNS